MRTFTSRLRTSTVVAFVSSDALATKSTAICTLLILPVLDVAFWVALAGASGGIDLTTTAYVGLLVALGMAVMSDMVSLVTVDRQLGLMQDILGRGVGNPTYWLGKLAVPTAAGVSSSLIAATAIFLTDGQHDLGALLWALLLMPVSLFVGAVLGVAASVGSLRLNDPYLIANVLRMGLVVMAGVVAPLSAYPEWLATVSAFVPFSHLVEAYRLVSSMGDVSGAAEHLLLEVTVVAGWTALAAVSARTLLSDLRSGKHKEELW